MRGYYKSAAAALALASSSIASAADISLSEICDDAEGNGTYTVDPLKLRRHVLRTAKVNVVAFDTNADGGADANEIFLGLAHPDICLTGETPGTARYERGRCAEGDEINIRAAHNLLSQFMVQRNIRIVEVEGAPDSDPRLAPGREVWNYWRLIDEQRRYVQMECVRTPEEIAAAAAPPPTPPRRTPPPPFLLTRNITDLTLPRAPRLKNVPQAEISFIDDNIANTNTLRVHGTAGVVLARTEDLTLIPYVQFIHSTVEDTTGVKEQEETSKLSIGAVAGWYVGRYDLLDIAPAYVNDLEDGAEFVSLRLGWRPGFLYGLQSFRTMYQFGCRAADRRNGGCAYQRAYLGLRTDFQLLGSYSHVLDVGTNPALVADRDYLRAGAEARVSLFGLRGEIRDLSIDASYRHMFGLGGGPGHISAFTAGVNYWIGGSPNASLRYGYERRRDEETLKRTDQWTVALGLRF